MTPLADYSISFYKLASEFENRFQNLIAPYSTYIYEYLREQDYSFEYSNIFYSYEYYHEFSKNILDMFESFEKLDLKKLLEKNNTRDFWFGPDVSESSNGCEITDEISFYYFAPFFYYSYFQYISEQYLEKLKQLNNDPKYSEIEFKLPPHSVLGEYHDSYFYESSKC